MDFANGVDELRLGVYQTPKNENNNGGELVKEHHMR